ncbi:hypothetical protein V5O48_016024 [Marasmius crinis-equi]|uniref:Uncharacterized protein n=1 Tax=Marasmius crinis-equi TaxID=585013 RepID=A0ABR3ET07_9AGAR
MVGTTPRGPTCPGGSTTSVRSEKGKEAITWNTESPVSRAPAAIPLRKPEVAETRASPEAAGSAPTSAATNATLPPPASNIGRPIRATSTTERAKMEIGAPLPPSALPPASSSRAGGTTATAKKSVSANSDGATTGSQRPTPPALTRRTSKTRDNTISSSSGVKAQAGTGSPSARERVSERRAPLSPMAGRMRMKASSNGTQSRPPASVGTSSRTKITRTAR